MISSAILRAFPVGSRSHSSFARTSFLNQSSASGLLGEAPLIRGKPGATFVGTTTAGSAWGVLEDREPIAYLRAREGGVKHTGASQPSAPTGIDPASLGKV